MQSTEYNQSQCCKKIEKNVSKFVERGIKIFAAVYATNDFMLA